MRRLLQNERQKKVKYMQCKKDKKSLKYIYILREEKILCTWNKNRMLCKWNIKRIRKSFWKWWNIIIERRNPMKIWELKIEKLTHT